MTDTVPTDPAPVTEDASTPWVAPRVQTIAAGDAEEGTRMRNQDGRFTTS